MSPPHGSFMEGNFSVGQSTTSIYCYHFLLLQVSTIPTQWKIQCLPYAGFFTYVIAQKSKSPLSCNLRFGHLQRSTIHSESRLNWKQYLITDVSFCILKNLGGKKYVKNWIFHCNALLLKIKPLRMYTSIRFERSHNLIFTSGNYHPPPPKSNIVSV